MARTISLNYKQHYTHIAPATKGVATILPTSRKGPIVAQIFFRNLAKDGQISKAEITMLNLCGGKKASEERNWPFQEAK